MTPVLQLTPFYNNLRFPLYVITRCTVMSRLLPLHTLEKYAYMLHHLYICSYILFPLYRVYSIESTHKTGMNQFSNYSLVERILLGAVTTHSQFTFFSIEVYRYNIIYESPCNF